MAEFFWGFSGGCVAMYFLFVKGMIQELNRLTRLAYGLPSKK
ncbi:hypothetical protein [Vibrio coralliilyticus]|nr:hypothetical protein [Vibrio coralliilyticus]